jgi:hypothetical protein
MLVLFIYLFMSCLKSSKANYTASTNKYKQDRQCMYKCNINTLGMDDADLRFYRVLQSFVSFVTTSRRVTQICVFTRGWIPHTLHLITQYLDPFFE